MNLAVDNLYGSKIYTRILATSTETDPTKMAKCAVKIDEYRVKCSGYYTNGRDELEVKTLRTEMILIVLLTLPSFVHSLILLFK